MEKKIQSWNLCSRPEIFVKSDLVSSDLMRLRNVRLTPWITLRPTLTSQKEKWKEKNLQKLSAPWSLFMPGASQFIILSMSEENIKLEGSKYHQCNSPINILSGRCKVANDLLTLTFRDESEQQLTSDTRGRELGRESFVV